MNAIRAVAAALSLMLAPATHAVVLSGDFFGYVRSSTNPQTPVGSAAGGRFSFDTDYPYAAVGVGNPQMAGYEGFADGRELNPITVDIGVREGQGGSTGSLGYLSVRLFDDGIQQYLDFSSFFVRGAGAGMRLVATSGSLFENLDLQTLTAGDIDLSQSFAYFSVHSVFGAEVALTELRFDQALPEPPPLTIIVLAMSLAACVVRFRKLHTMP